MAMNATPITMSESVVEWKLPSRGHVGVLCLIAAESSIFIIFVVAYLFYLGKSLTGPTPKDVLRVPIFYSICLLSSSVTIHFAVRALRHKNIRSFAIWWMGTIALGGAFLYGTVIEWHRLIYEKGLTISTKPVRNNLLLIGWPAWISCGGRTPMPLHSNGVHTSGQLKARTHLSRRCVVLLLALR